MSWDQVYTDYKWEMCDTFDVFLNLFSTSSVIFETYGIQKSGSCTNVNIFVFLNRSYDHHTRNIASKNSITCNLE